MQETEKENSVEPTTEPVEVETKQSVIPSVLLIAVGAIIALILSIIGMVFFAQYP